MPSESQPLLRREAPPSTGFSTFLFGTSTAVGVGSAIYQGMQRPVSWPGLAVSILCTVVSAAGLLTVRSWSKWSRTENSETSSTNVVAQRSLSPPPVNEQVLQLLLSLEQTIAQLLAADDTDEKDNGVIPEDSEEVISISDPASRSLEERLRQLIEQAGQLADRFDETRESINRLKSTVQIFASQLQGTDLAARQVSPADSSSSDLLAQLASLQSEIAEMRTPSGSRHASPNRSRHASPARQTATTGDPRS